MTRQNLNTSISLDCISLHFFILIVVLELPFIDFSEEIHHKMRAFLDIIVVPKLAAWAMCRLLEVKEGIKVKTTIGITENLEWGIE